MAKATGKTDIQYLEDKIDSVAASVNLLATNHLPHIQAAIDTVGKTHNDFHVRFVRIEERIAMLVKTYWIVVVAIVGAVVALILK